MRATVTAKHAVDGVAPGAEGVFADTHATRAMIAAGLLLPLEELPPEPPPRVKAAPVAGGPSASSDLEALRRANADGVALVAKLRATAEKLEAENATLRAELEASKAKAPKAPKTPPAEG